MRTQPRALLRLADEIVVPLPPLTTQERIAAAYARLDAAAGMVDRARRDVWTAPAAATDVVSRFAPLSDESLVRWCDDLPYPVASALWTLDSKRFNVDAAHKQVFLVWEAYAAFTATVLLSALAQDPAMQDEQLPGVRAALAGAHLTMERATLGTWTVIVQRLAGHFRTLLAKEDRDGRARVLRLFAGPDHESLARLLSPVVVRLLSDANARRNAWDGHTGAVPEEELQDRLAYLTGRLEELRDHVGSAWTQLQLVRAGYGSRQRDQIVQKVELASGPNTPFRPREMRVPTLLEKGALYIARDDADQPLPLLPLVVLTPGVRCDCYVFNRLEGETKARLVCYHLADRSEMSESRADVLRIVRALAPESG